MTEEQVTEGSSILHKIKRCKEDLDQLNSFKGNKWWIGYGQDKGHGYDLSVDNDQFDAVMNFLKAIKKQELEQLEKQLSEL